MTRNETRWIHLAVAVAAVIGVLSSGCGQKKDLGQDVDIAVSGEGVIIPGDYQNCTDKATYTTKRSVTAPALVFNNFALKYTGVGKQLFLTSLKITAKGGGITTGKAEFLVSSIELEGLVGRRGPLIEVPVGSTEVIINSNVNSGRTSTFPACSLAVGPVGIVNADSTFTASIDMKLTGTASNTLTGEVERVEEKITTKAFF